MNDLNLKTMSVGDEKLVDISAGVDEKFLKTSGGKRINKNEVLLLSDKNGREYFFEVKRIIGESYLILTEKSKRPRLSMSDAFKLLYLTLTRRRL